MPTHRQQPLPALMPAVSFSVYEPDRSGQQVPEMLEREEMFSTDSTKIQLFTPQREEDQQQEDHLYGLENNIFQNYYFDEDFQLPNFNINMFHLHSFRNLNLYLIAKNPVNDFLWTVKNDSNLPSMISRTANLQDLQAAVVLPNYSPSDFSTVGIRQTSLTEKIMLLKDAFIKLTTCRDKKQLFKRIMTLFSEAKNDLGLNAVPAGRHLELWLKSYQTKHKRGKQYAFAVCKMKNGKYKHFQGVCPCFRNKKRKSSASPSTEVTSHSEESLIRQIDKFLLNNGTNVRHILIYTLNSPCLKREKHIEPCMFKLLEMADQWLSKYGFFTDVAFTKFWGLTGPNYFADLKFSDISSPSSCFYPYVQTCKKTPFKLDSTFFRKDVIKCGIYRTLYDIKDTKQRSKPKGDIQSCLHKLVKLAENSVNLRKDQHVARGVKMISSLTFHPLIHNKIIDILTKNWNEMVIYSSMSPIREQINTDFNTAVVHLFLKYLKSTLGNSSPLQLYQVPRTE
ncbi:uncharacterized protein LOC123958071 [Micropterus dolomieu]|uniref:uncharacterized protein LOC123958071 n=1 Tax=Micropterus dolomieu TaxID=147949 RepID=UPI001E8CA4B3|nr:uncharacterized protein LOC123958071 [Micropterus dolomieu]